jgi:hypothetical protein
MVGRFEPPPPAAFAASDDDWVPSEQPQVSEEERIQRARANLIGVNSLTCLDDFEVRRVLACPGCTRRTR